MIYLEPWSNLRRFVCCPKVCCWFGHQWKKLFIFKKKNFKASQIMFPPTCHCRTACSSSQSHGKLMPTVNESLNKTHLSAQTLSFKGFGWWKKSFFHWKMSCCWWHTGNKKFETLFTAALFSEVHHLQTSSGSNCLLPVAAQWRAGLSNTAV